MEWRDVDGITGKIELCEVACLILGGMLCPPGRIEINLGHIGCELGRKRVELGHIGCVLGWKRVDLGI